MEWDRQQERELDRLPHLMHGRLRARAETNDFPGMIALYEKSEKQIAKLTPPDLRDLCRLILFAFCGKREEVQALFRGNLATLPVTTQRFWLATSELFGGHAEVAFSQFEKLRAEADRGTQIAVERRLAQVAGTPAASDAATQALLERTIAEQGHEQRFAAAPKLLSRAAMATQLILFSNLAMFVVEMLAGGSTSFPVLYRLGALYPPAVRAGEWWRVVVSTFLHLGPVHLSMNMIALWVFAPFLEMTLGFTRFLFLYLAAGIGSMVVVYALAAGATQQITIGASGSIMGLLGATGALMLRGWLKDKASVARRRLIAMATILAAQSLLDAVVPQVSMKAHLSGAAIGFLLGLLLSPAEDHRLTSRQTTLPSALRQ